MNLLSLILIFLAIVICAAVAYIAWELTDEDAGRKPAEKGHGSERVPDRKDRDSQG